MLNASGIYEILNTVNGKRYIGSAVRLAKRFAVHRQGLRRGIHHCQPLQRAWNKYGEAAFVFSPILMCSRGNLIMYEQLSMAALQPEYNTAPVAGSQLGTKRTDVSRKRMSAAATGKVIPDETRAKMSVANKGRIVSQEARDKISIARKGNTVWLGRKHTRETKKRMSEWQRGRPGKPRTIAARLKQSVATRGVPKTLAHRAAISVALKVFYANKKEQQP